ncbi:MAG: DNA-binding protein [Dokdonella sp.]
MNDTKTRTTVFQRKTAPERVLTACEALGDDASGRNVRALLGGGSLRDITPLVTEWKARRAADIASTGDDGKHRRLPAPVPARFERLERRVLESQARASETMRSHWQYDLAGVRTELRQLLTATRPTPTPNPSSIDDTATLVSLAPKLATASLPLELNETLGRIDLRLTALEASFAANISPALAITGAVSALVDRLDALAAHIKSQGGRVTGEASLDLLVAGQEALASTIGFCAQGTVKALTDTLERIDRRQLARTRRARAAPVSPASRSSTSDKKPRHDR